MTGKELVKRLKRDGWALDRIKGSHHIMIKGKKPFQFPSTAAVTFPPEFCAGC